MMALGLSSSSWKRDTAAGIVSEAYIDAVSTWSSSFVGVVGGSALGGLEGFSS
jgi:hypothetical protein